jgi:hypothetical protein
MCTNIQTNTNLFTNFEKNFASPIKTKQGIEVNETPVTNNIQKDSKPSEIKKGSAIKEINFTETIDPPKNKEVRKNNIDKLAKLYGNDVNIKEPNSNSTLQEKIAYKNKIVNNSAGLLKKRVSSPAIGETVTLKNRKLLIPDDINKTVIRKYTYESKDKALDNHPIIKFRFNNDMNKNLASIPKLNAKDYGKDKAFFYVNGMVTDEKTAKSTGKELEKILGNKINVIHNPTKGGLSDFIESLQERHNVFVPGITKEMINGTLYDEITIKTANQFLEQINNGKDLKIVCHSQGGAITSNALEYSKEKLLSEGKSKKELQNIFSKIEVITLGAASSPDKFPEGVKIVQITHPKDPVPKVAGQDLSYESDEIIKSNLRPNVETQKSIISSSDTNIFSFIDRFDVAIDGLKRALITDNLDSRTRIDFDNHGVSGDYQSYLTQKDTRSLLFNFGRQDFQ